MSYIHPFVTTNKPSNEGFVSLEDDETEDFKSLEDDVRMKDKTVLKPTSNLSKVLVC